YEKQADLLGTQIMARAGYDPRALARMFETIERDSKSNGGSGPQWMSSHPNPGNRTQYINKEAAALTIAPAACEVDARSVAKEREPPLIARPAPARRSTRPRRASSARNTHS